MRKISLGDPVLNVKYLKSGIIKIKNSGKPKEWPSNITRKLEYWAEKKPNQIYLAERNNLNNWKTLTYKETLKRIKSLSFYLSTKNLSEKSPLIILSGNDLNHATIALTCLYSNIPYSAISPSYSLLSNDFKKLDSVLKILKPGFVFVSDGHLFKAAIDKIGLSKDKIIVGNNPLKGNLLLEDIIEKYFNFQNTCFKTNSNQVAKFLFTSGSTGSPKAVIQTHGMLSSNMAMALKAYKFLEKEPPTVVDWMPWSHTAGGNKVFNMVLYAGGTFYIDKGSPSDEDFWVSIKNLGEISPSWYFNVPKGYEYLVRELNQNEKLSYTFFKKIKLLVYSGASMPDYIFKNLDKLAMKYAGEKIFISAAYGASESAPMATMPSFKSNSKGNIGVPQFGTEMKLVPFGDKYEVRLKGPNVTPGYWKDKKTTESSIDKDGFFKIGDSLRFAKKNDPRFGFYFDGRVAENFKLNTGSWVSVGKIRDQLVNELGSIVSDAIIIGENQTFLSAFLIPNLSHCKRLCNIQQTDFNKDSILQNYILIEKIITSLKKLKNKTKSKSQYVKRVVLFKGRLSKVKGEITQKGSINQIAFILNRKGLVKELQRGLSNEFIEI